MFEARLSEFRDRLEQAGIDVGVITDDDNVYYLTGYYDYLHMEFGRPTILVVPRGGDSVLITPSLDGEMAKTTARVDQVALWNDGVGDEWRADLPVLVKGTIGLEPHHMPPIVRAFIDTLGGVQAAESVTPILAKMRMIKSNEELQLARHAGQVGMAMMNAGRATIAAGVPEYEVALATSRAGTRKAADLLAQHYDDPFMSPNAHFLQIMASGPEITKTHHRASTRIMQRREPVFLCFCGMTNFHRFKLGFDRTFWIEEMSDPEHARLYDIAIASQAATMAELRPGAIAEDVHAAYSDVIQSAGFGAPFRSGRATGFSFLEAPQLVTGDKTVLQPGMVFAVDGCVEGADFRAQVGDSFIITEDGYEQITQHPKAIDEMIIPMR